MNVLHIANDFPFQRMYSTLFLGLADRSILQQIISPIRRSQLRFIDLNSKLEQYTKLMPMLNFGDTLLFRRRIGRIARNVLKEIGTFQPDIIHAHNLYADGGVAWILSKTLGVPYIVNVRNTDVNVYDRYRPDLHNLRNAIIGMASTVIFLSPAQRAVYLSRVDQFVGDIRLRSVVIPNAVDPFWLDHLAKSSADGAPRSRLNVLYVGDLSKNKNLRNLILAAGHISANMETSLTVVGGEHSVFQKEYAKYLRQGLQVTHLSHVSSKEELVHIYRNADVFAMPSFTESFGMSYIEALSQNIPIVCSENQGVDGYFDGSGMAQRCDPANVESIANAILRARDAHPTSNNVGIDLSMFSQTRVVDRHVELYGACMT